MRLRSAAQVAVEEPTARERDRFERWWRQLLASAQQRPRPAWAYLIVTPLGLPASDRIGEVLSKLGMTSLLRTRIDARRWPRVDTAVHLRGAAPGQLRRALLYEQAWTALFPGMGGEAWQLSIQDIARLAEHKVRLRAELPSLAVQLAPALICGLHPFHLPDPEDAAREAAMVEEALRRVRGVPPRRVRSPV